MYRTGVDPTVRVRVATGSFMIFIFIIISLSRSTQYSMSSYRTYECATSTGTRTVDTVRVLRVYTGTGTSIDSCCRLTPTGTRTVLVQYLYK